MTIHTANMRLNQARLDGDSENINVALIQLAHLHFRQGRYNQTQILSEEVIKEALPDSGRICDALILLGNCAAELGDPDKAETYYHQARNLALQLDYHYALYKCLHSLATNIYWPRGQFDLCLAAGKEALSQAQGLGLKEELWFPLSDISWVYWSTGQQELACQIADQMEVVVSPGSLGQGFYCCLRAGLTELGDEFIQNVLPLYDCARSIAEKSGDPGLNVEVRLGLCRSYHAVKDLSTASVWADDAVDVCKRANYRQFQGVTLIERGRIQAEKGNLDAAEMDLRCAVDISTQLRSMFDLTRATFYLAGLLSRQSKPGAEVFWQKAIQLIMDNGYDFLIEQERSLILPWIAETLNDPDLELSRTSAVLFNHLANIPPIPLRVKMFGQFSLQMGTRLVSRESLRQRRAGELLALLLSSNGYTLSAEQVTEAMCPEKEPDAAVDFFHHAISALRHLLEPDLPDRRFPCRYLEASDERITLIVPAGCHFDFLDFEQCIQKNQWEKAIEIYQGDFLPMYRYAEWTLMLRQHFADQFEQALLFQAVDRLNVGDAKFCLDLARRALLHNPWQEQAVELGMRATLEMGDRIAAIKLYKGLEKRLKADLGIAPQNELQRLYKHAMNRSKK